MTSDHRECDRKLEDLQAQIKALQQAINGDCNAENKGIRQRSATVSPGDDLAPTTG